MPNERFTGTGDSDMSIGVTGASGFIGRALCERLRREGLPCLVLQRFGHASAASFPSRQLPPQSAGLEPWVRALEGVTALVHLAAHAHQPERAGAAFAALLQSSNVEFSARLAAAAQASGVSRFIYLSSVKVYGERSVSDGLGGLCRFGPASEPHPESVYGWSKWRAESRLRDICHSGAMNLIVLRPPLVYGAGMRGNLQTLMRVLACGTPLPLAAIENRRSLLSRDALVEVLLRALQCSPAPAGRAWPLADLEVSTPALIRLMAGSLGRPPRLWACPPALLKAAAAVVGRSAMMARMTESLVVDSSAASEVFGLQPLADPEAAWAVIGQAFRRGGSAWR